MLKTVLKEKNLLLGVAIAAIATPLEHAILHMGQAASLIAALLMISGIILVALRVAHHAEILAEKVGEPYGTMILTLSAVLVEVVILAIMLSHNPSPTLARDTIYSALMLDINGILGIAALIGGFKHGEQSYNVDSGQSYIVMILTAVGVSMVLPEFMGGEHRHLYALFSIGSMVILYAIFLRLQTKEHSYFFSYSYAETGSHGHHEHPGDAKLSAVLLVVGLIIIGFMAEIMAKFLDVGIAGTAIPPVFAAVVVAAISASPEIMTAMRAALGNRMQPVVNIALGASLSTVVLTVPVIEALSLINHYPMEMALTPAQTALTFLTLMVASISLNDGKTNAIEGMTHFILFCAFVMLTFMGL